MTIVVIASHRIIAVDCCHLMVDVKNTGNVNCAQCSVVSYPDEGLG